jgi:hypothetical protein
MVDAGELAGAVMPYLAAAASVYGGAVVQRVADQAADATTEASVGLGRRLLRRLSGSARAAQIEDAVADLGGQPDDEAQAGIVRAQVRKALTDDPALADEIAQMLAAAGHGGGRYSVTVTGSQGVQIGDRNTQTNTFGTPGR